MLLLLQVALLGAAQPSGRLTVLVQALTAARLAAADTEGGGFQGGTEVPTAVQVTTCKQAASWQPMMHGCGYMSVQLAALRSHQHAASFIHLQADSC